MDALSRLLASVGRSLGEGLQRVGETELQKQQQADAIRTQAFEQLRVKLFEEYLKAAGNPGFAALTPEEQGEFQRTLALLSVPGGRLDENAYSAAVNLLARVNQQGGLIGTLKTLIERGSLGEAGALLVDMDEGEARRLLRLLGSEGLYPSLITQGRYHRELQAVGLGKEKAQYRMLLSQLEHFDTIRPLLIDLMKAQINELIEKTRGQELQNQKLREELKTLPDTLEAARREALAKAAMSEEDARRYPEYLEAKIRELGARIGLTEAQINLVLEQAGLTKAQSRLVEAQAEGEELRNKLMKEYGFQKEKAETVAELVKAYQDVDDPGVMARLLAPVIGEDMAQQVAPFIAEANQRRNRAAELDLRAKEYGVSRQELELADAFVKSLGANPLMSEEDMIAALRRTNLPEHMHSYVVGKAKALQMLSRLGLSREVWNIVAEMPIPQNEEDMSRMLGPVYRELVQLYTGIYGDENVATRFANGVINNIKDTLRLAARESRAKVAKEEATADRIAAEAQKTHVETEHIPLQHALEREKVAIARGQLALGWASYGLQEKIFGLNQQQFTWGQLKDLLETAARLATATGLPDADAFKKEVDTLNKLYDAGMRALAAAAPGCINNNVIPGTSTVYGLALGLDERCRRKVEEALDKAVITVQNENGETESLKLRQVFDQVDKLYAITVSRASSYLGMAGAAASGGIGAVPFVFNPAYQSVYNRMLEMAGLPPVDFNQLFPPSEGGVAPPPPGTTAPPPPGASGPGVGGGRLPEPLRAESIARNNFTPENIGTALTRLGGIGGAQFTPRVVAGLGYAAITWPGEGGVDNPLQLQDEWYAEQKAECNRVSGGHVATNAVCQGIKLAEGAGFLSNPQAFHAGLVGLRHMFPAAYSAIREGRMRPIDTLVSHPRIPPHMVTAQSPVISFARVIRGLDDDLKLTPADVSAYYAYYSIRTWKRDLGLEALRDDQIPFFAYAMAFLPPARQHSRETLKGAIRMAQQFLGAKPPDEESLNALADALGFIVSRANMGYMGNALASRANQRSGGGR